MLAQNALSVILVFMHKVTITERIHQNDNNETIVNGFNIAVEPPASISDEDVVRAFGANRIQLRHSPHTFNDIGRVTLGDTNTAFSVGRDDSEFQGLFYGHQGSPLADGAAWVVSSIMADLLGSKGLKFDIKDSRDPRSPSYADLPQPWVAATN